MNNILLDLSRYCDTKLYNDYIKKKGMLVYEIYSFILIRKCCLYRFAIGCVAGWVTYFCCTRRLLFVCLF